MKEWQLKLNEYTSKVKDRWSALAVREKQAVAIGGSLLGIFVVYAGMWSPLVGHVANMRSRIESDQKTLTFLQVADKEIQKIERNVTAKNKAASPVVLLGVLQKQINHAGLDANLTQLKQATNETIEMHFQKIAFDKLVRLLMTVSKEQAISVSQMSVTAENAPGMVNADITLKIG